MGTETQMGTGMGMGMETGMGTGMGWQWDRGTHQAGLVWPQGTGQGEALPASSRQSLWRSQV